jgi:hypothetical protein
MFSIILQRHQYISASISISISSGSLSKLGGTSNVLKSMATYSFRNTTTNGDATSLIP